VTELELLPAKFAKRPRSVFVVTHARLKIGRDAEDLVAFRLLSAGWKILARNARTRYGELDIVAFDKGTLVFIEVKAGREGSAFGPERPVHSVGPRKQRQIRRLAAAWMSEHRDAPRYSEIRFDAVGVTYDANARHAIAVEHLVSAF
jgi:putative endonuclease